MGREFTFEAEPFEFVSELDEYQGEQTNPPCQCHQIAREKALYDPLSAENETSEEYETVRGYDDLLLEEEAHDEFEATRRFGDIDLEETDVPQQGEYEIIPPDSRRRVKQPTAAPFRYICNLEYDVPSVGRRSICTGTLIGPRTVLTAGHCLSGLTPSSMRVIPGRNGTLEPLPATAVTRFILPNNYGPTTPTDYGITHLADPIGNTVGYWSQTYRTWPNDPIGISLLSGGLPLSAGKLKVNLSGYPADKPFGKKFGCTDQKQPRQRCRISTLSNPKRHRLCGTFQYRAYDRTVLLRGGMLHYLNDTCPGHSGSPVWVRRHPSMGGRVLVAVHVAGDDGTGVVANRSVFITPQVRQFIVTNTI